MRGNPNLRAESVHPFHRSEAIIDVPDRERAEAIDHLAGQKEFGEQISAPRSQAQQGELAAGLAGFSWRRQEPALDQPPSSAKGHSHGPTSVLWRDQLLAEIEVLAERLKAKVARYSLLRAAQFSNQAGEQADETAVVWIQDALEDIAATALGIEIASRELFLQAASAGEQESNSETAQEQTPGDAE